MSSRSSRRAQAQVPLTNSEALLLAQAVWELGANTNSWAPISKILSKHPLITRPRVFSSPQSCHSMYESLMKEAGLEVNESSNEPHSPLNLQLAQKHYRSRFLELQALILAEESKFKAVLKEIEELKAGGGSGNGAVAGEAAPKQKSRCPAKSIEVRLDQVNSIYAVSNSSKSVDELPDSADHYDATKSIPSPRPAEHDSHEETTTSDGGMVNGREMQPGIDSGKHSSPNADAAFIQTSRNLRSSAEDIREPQDGDESAAARSEHDNADEIEMSETTAALREDLAEDSVDHKEEEQEQAAASGERGEAKGEGAESSASPTQSEVNVDQQSTPSVKELPTEPSGQDGEAEFEVEGQDESTELPEQVDADTDVDSVHSPASADAEAAMDEAVSSDVEPVVQMRRSSRRRKSSAASVPPPQPRKRLRSKGQLSELEPQTVIDSENENDIGTEEDTPARDDERASSPFEGPTTRRRDGKRKASFLDPDDSSPEKKRVREDSVPIDEDGPSHSRLRTTRHTTKTEEQVALKKFQNVISMLHSQISQHRNGNIFHNPIKDSEAPDYHEIVKRPMDLKTIKTRVKDGVIANSLEYQRDIYLMFANAMMYNRPGSDVHAMAEDMMIESEGQINAFRQTEGLVKRGQRP
ncbi:hypothetical protein CPC08DRAFT_746866 [Agrocybe pediades]|nr:hypothetical protein CPC08DRAFT_746866 [Agrocybe pediades]